MKQTNRLRNMLGIMGVFLPILDMGFNLIFGQGYNPAGVLTSISATHYSAAYLLFEGLVVGVGLFLICYEGYDLTDRVWSIIAGTGALLLCFFPCDLPGDTAGEYTRNFMMINQRVTMIFHYIGAGSFFGALVIIIGFQFTKSKEFLLNPRSPKGKRNMLYRICAAGMIVALAGSALLPLGTYKVYIGETIALWLFGLAWLTKGGLILRDI